MLELKRKAAEERTKRDLVLKRKLFLDDKMSDVISFLSNSENLWEILGNEKDLEELVGFTMGGETAAADQNLFDLLQKDHFEIEKLKLKRDAEILSHLIIQDEQGNIFANKGLLPYAVKKLKRHEGFLSEDSSSDEGEEGADIEEATSTTHYGSPPRRILEEIKRGDCANSDENETLIGEGATSVQHTTTEMSEDGPVTSG